MSAELTTSCFIVGSSRPAHWMNIGVLVLGTGIGWFLGTFISPYTKVEAATFEVYAKAVSVFITGYLLAKIDTLVTEVFTTKFLFGSSIRSFHTILFFAAALITMLMVFVMRQYGEGLTDGGAVPLIPAGNEQQEAKESSSQIS